MERKSIMTSFPPYEHMKIWFDTPESCLLKLIEFGVLTIPRCDHACHNKTNLPRDSEPPSWSHQMNFKDGYIYRCTAKECRKERSILNGTLFSRSRLPVNKIIHVGYLWLANIKIEQISMIIGCSIVTATQWWQYFNQVVSQDLENRSLTVNLHESISNINIDNNINIHPVEYSVNSITKSTSSKRARLTTDGDADVLAYTWRSRYKDELWSRLLVAIRNMVFTDE